MPSVIILLSLWGCHHSQPYATANLATEDVLSGQAARPPRHFPSQASEVKPSPSWAAAITFKIFFHLPDAAYALPFTLLWLSKQLWRKLVNYLRSLFCLILACLNVTTIFLALHLLVVLSWFLPGKAVSSPPWADNIPPSFISDVLSSSILFLPFFLWSPTALLLHVITSTAFPKECTFSSSKRKKGMPAGIRQISGAVIVSVLPASAGKWDTNTCLSDLLAFN